MLLLAGRRAALFVHDDFDLLADFSCDMSPRAGSAVSFVLCWCQSDSRIGFYWLEAVTAISTTVKTADKIETVDMNGKRKYCWVGVSTDVLSVAGNSSLQVCIVCLGWIFRSVIMVLV